MNISELSKQKKEFELYAELTRCAEEQDKVSKKSLLDDLLKRTQIEDANLILNAECHAIDDKLDALKERRSVLEKKKNAQEDIAKNLSKNSDTTRTSEKLDPEVQQNAHALVLEFMAQLTKCDDEQVILEDSKKGKTQNIDDNNKNLEITNSSITRKIEAISGLVIDEYKLDCEMANKAKGFLNSRQVTTRKSSDWEDKSNYAQSKIDDLSRQVESLKREVTKSETELERKKILKEQKNKEIRDKSKIISDISAQLTQLDSQIVDIKIKKFEKEEALTKVLSS